MIAALDRSQFRPEVVVHRNGALSGFLSDRAIPHQILGFGGYLHGGIGLTGYVAAAGTVLKARRFISAERFDIVHGNDLRVNQTWSVAAKTSRAKHVWHQRTKYSRSKLAAATMRKAAATLCVSEFCRDSLPLHVRQKAVVLTDPFDTGVQVPNRDEARTRLMEISGWPSDTTVFGFCGTLSIQKRPRIFIETAAAIAESDPNARFALLGLDRDNRIAELRLFADALGLGDRLTFLGFQPDGMEWIAAFDILLAPQFDDAFGRNIVEAMFVGTPVIASATGGHHELIEEGVTGRLIEQDNVAGFVDAALDLSQDATRVGCFVEAARRSLEGRMDLNKQARRCEQIYRSLFADQSVGESNLA